MKKLIILFVIVSLFSQVLFAQKADKKSETWVEKTLKSLTLRQKIGQMINFRLSGEFSNIESDKFKESAELAVKQGIGGFTVYRGNANSVALMTNELQKLSNIPLLFSADYERGLRMQMPLTGTPFTTAMGVGATGDAQAAFRQGKIICEEMRAIGVQWQFAPVADLNNNPDNPVINIRSYGENPNKVAEMVTAFSKGTQAANCLSTLKHFPGHGDTATDSHIGLGVINVDKTRLDSTELVPFNAAIKQGADSVMTAHLAVPKVTGNEIPATLNPKISTDLLRNELGFNGIIVTDAMEMGAIEKNYSREKSVVMAVQAGADVVLLPLSVSNAIDSIEAAVKKGELTEERINSSVRKILAAKYKLGLVQNRFVDSANIAKMIEKPENVKEANNIAEKSITLLRNDKDLLPLSADKAKKTLYLVIAADDEPERIVEGVAFIPEVQRRLPNAKIYRLDLRTTQAEYDKVFAEAKDYEAIVLAPFVKRAANKGTVKLPELQTNFVRKMLASDKDVAVIAFGSPYLIRQFPEAKTYAVTYAIEEVAQFAAAKTLFGEVKFQGHLPVSIPDLFPVGSGIVR
jgi:beta-N-acetylhexosaminidase